MEPRQHSWRKWLAVAGALLTAIFPTCVQAVVLEWETNSEPDVAGYRIYMGPASRSYNTIHEAGNQTSAEITVLQPGKTFYFAVTAYNTDGLESDFSEEVSYTVPTPPQVPCDECFGRIADFFTAHGNPLPAGTVPPSADDCITATARLLERAARASQGDAGAAGELISIAECLGSAIDHGLAEQRDKVSAMYPSRWSAAASNVLNSLPAGISGPDPLVVARSLVRRGRALHRLEQFIARGTIAPSSLDGRVFTATLLESGVRERFTISFMDGIWLATAPVRQLEVDWGLYRFEQTAWNRGTLELNSESGDMLTLQLAFKRTRVAVSGPNVTGWFITFQ